MSTETTTKKRSTWKKIKHNTKKAGRKVRKGVNKAGRVGERSAHAIGAFALGAGVLLAGGAAAASVADKREKRDSAAA